MVDHSLYSGMDTARERGADRQQTGEQDGWTQIGVLGRLGRLTGWHTVDRWTSWQNGQAKGV